MERRVALDQRAAGGGGGGRGANNGSASPSPRSSCVGGCVVGAVGCDGGKGSFRHLTIFSFRLLTSLDLTLGDLGDGAFILHLALGDLADGGFILDLALRDLAGGRGSSWFVGHLELALGSLGNRGLA